MTEPLEQRLLLAVLYVDLNSPGPLHDGSAWDSAYPDLQPALINAKAGDEIRIATGTYKPTATTDRTQSFRLKSGVSLLGGYAGFGAPNPDARDIALYPTLLSGEIGDPTTTSDNSYHVVYAENVDATTILDGLTITAGYANGITDTPESRGGGMYNINSSPTLTNCTFSNNTAAGDGAAIYNYASSPSLTACTFAKNWAWGGGGGMYNDASRPVLTDCIFSGGHGYYGGGMYNSASSPILTNCIFRDNSAEVYAGGMYNLNTSSPALTNCTLTGNSANFGGGMVNDNNSAPSLTQCTFDANQAFAAGGGMSNLNSSPTLTNCTFKDNSDRRGGGGMANASSSPTLTNCTFTGNQSYSRDGGRGGGMYNAGGSPTLVNCTFIANGAVNNADFAAYGGGMYNDSSSPRLINCTFTANYASGYFIKGIAGGIYNYDSSPILTNCILWGDTAGEIVNEGTSTPTITYTLIQGGWQGTCNFDADPQFVRNPSPGPDGIWGSDDDACGDLHLRSTSPAVNAGSNAALPAGFTKDLAGNPRILDGAVDLGAYEYPADHLTINGSDGPDTFYLRPSASGLAIYPTADSQGQPLQIIDSDRLSTTHLSLSGGDGDDCFILDFSRGNFLPGLGLSLSGGTGSNRLVLLGSEAAESFVISDAQVQYGDQTIALDQVQQSELDGRGGLDTLTLGGTTQMKLRASQHLASLSLGEGATLDLADHDLIVSATPETRAAVLAALSQAIQSARGSDGKWAGAGLTSSSAKANKQTGLAVMLNHKNGQPILTTFAGQGVGVNDILVKYTWNGDINLDGQVDAADYFLIDSGYITQRSGYQNGDLNLDGTVDAADYFLVDSAYIAQTAVMAATEVAPQKVSAAPPARTPARSLLAELFSTEPLL